MLTQFLRHEVTRPLHHLEERELHRHDLSEGHAVSHAHIRYLRPFPKNLGEIIQNFDQVLIPEINNGQLVKIIRDQYMVDAKAYNKVMGVPITKGELVEVIRKML